MPGLTIRGDVAEVRWGYRRAASLGRWTVTIGRETDAPGAPVVRRLEAAVGTVEHFALHQRPLVLVVARPGGVAWRWPIESIDLGDRSLIARLGAQEKANP